MKKECALCLKSNSNVHFFSKQYVCESCIHIAYEMIHKTEIKPNNDIEEVIFSIIFLLENEIIFAQDTLNNTKDLEKCKLILKEKLKLLNDSTFSVDNINPNLLQTLVNVKSRYKKTIELFIN